MASLARLLGNGLLGVAPLLHPRENLFITGNLSAANTEIVADCDGCASVMMDLRGTFSGTMEVAGTVDGTNWIPIPLRPVNQASKLWVATVVGTTQGLWAGECSGFRRVRARCTAFTSGTFVVTLSASLAAMDRMAESMVTPNLVTILGTAAAITTLTLPAPGAGLRHYITYLSINRFATALLTAQAAPVAVTTTNLPGTLAFSVPAEAAAQGTLDRWREDFAFPLAASAQNAATTIVCPATTAVQWRMTAGFYVAP